MEERKIKKFQEKKLIKKEFELGKPGRNGSINGDNLKESEYKFHQSQFTSSGQEEAGIPSSYNSAGPSRMKFNSMQDSFLNNCRHDRAVIEISLIDNTKEKGVIVGFDVNTIIMENELRYQFLIMKSAIVKIVPLKSVNYIFNDNYRGVNVLFDYSGMKDVGG